jgi:hypothetical protein
MPSAAEAAAASVPDSRQAQAEISAVLDTDICGFLPRAVEHLPRYTVQRTVKAKAAATLRRCATIQEL